MKSLVAALVTVVVLAFASAGLADPSSPDKGCHGYYTTQYKEAPAADKRLMRTFDDPCARTAQVFALERILI